MVSFPKGKGPLLRSKTSTLVAVRGNVQTLPFSSSIPRHVPVPRPCYDLDQISLPFRPWRAVSSSLLFHSPWPPDSRLLAIPTSSSTFHTTFRTLLSLLLSSLQLSLSFPFVSLLQHECSPSLWVIMTCLRPFSYLSIIEGSRPFSHLTARTDDSHATPLGLVSF